jgi:hypothetical protein
VTDRRKEALRKLAGWPTVRTMRRNGKGPLLPVVANPLYKRHKFPSKRPSLRASEIRKEFVRLDAITSNQKILFRTDLVEHVLRTKRNMREPLPLVYHFNGIYFTPNGNHRITANILKHHRRMRMRVINITPHEKNRTHTRRRAREAA